jgi:dTDP-4-amino-4,6-dideoxygalactose transaminase
MSIINYNKFTIPINDVKAYNQLFENNYISDVKELLNSGQYILGEHVYFFEQKMAEYIGIKYTIGVNSGTSALELAFQILELAEEDEVIIQANAYIACAFGALKSKAKLKIIDCDKNGVFDIEECIRNITIKTKAILVVHLYGDCCNMHKLTELCKNKGIYLIEDCAQSHGSKYDGKMLGSFGDISCFSFYPSKNLGALGDAGAIGTNNIEYYSKLKYLRNLGSQKKYEHEIIATNSRLDSLQALFLLSKFDDMDRSIAYKNTLVKKYVNSEWFTHLRNKDDKIYHSYHLYVIKLNDDIDRDKFMLYMEKNGIETIIHYKIPFYKSKAFNDLNYLSFFNAENNSNKIVSLPIYNTMTLEQVEYINNCLNNFTILYN